jgi:hypothetical protein
VKTLEDFDSSRVDIKKVPKTASLTCKGQVLIKPVVQPILFKGKANQMEWDTVKKFKISKEDSDLMHGVGVHKYNFVAQNV